MEKLLKAYSQIKMGDPLKSGILCGPLHTPSAVDAFKKGIEQVKKQNGSILQGGNVIEGPGNFVEPTITRISFDAPVVQNEIFVPVYFFSSLKKNIFFAYKRSRSYIQLRLKLYKKPLH
jgi:aldehyde dehydrogenase family 7 protein A1